METRLLSPPLTPRMAPPLPPTWLSATFLSPSSFRTWSTWLTFSRFSQCHGSRSIAEYITHSLTVSVGIWLSSWGTCAAILLNHWSRGWPSIWISPEILQLLICELPPARMLSSVLLPLPLGPMMAITRPFCDPPEMECKIVFLPPLDTWSRFLNRSLSDITLIVLISSGNFSSEQWLAPCECMDLRLSALLLWVPLSSKLPLLAVDLDSLLAFLGCKILLRRGATLLPTLALWSDAKTHLMFVKVNVLPGSNRLETADPPYLPCFARTFLRCILHRFVDRKKSARARSTPPRMPARASSRPGGDTLSSGAASTLTFSSPLMHLP
mmetsp:Transcript_10947/g.33440  ORF Transcript_10947/g.33440 Transcript_10947/m.33440 type:complete len:325 (+) Transcript_10947:1773-2747(+)